LGKVAIVSRSLSLVLPVRNAEKTLAENLQHLFDVLNDLTERFEVLLVDDGSTDQTVELAQDLAVQYPQVRLSRREAGNGDQSSLDGPLAEAVGDVVFVQTGHTDLRPSVLRELWAMNESSLESGTPKPSARGGLPGLPPRRTGPSSLRAWTEIAGLRMIRRR